MINLSTSLGSISYIFQYRKLQSHPMLVGTFGNVTIAQISQSDLRLSKQYQKSSLLDQRNNKITPLSKAKIEYKPPQLPTINLDESLLQTNYIRAVSCLKHNTDELNQIIIHNTIQNNLKELYEKQLNNLMNSQRIEQPPENKNQAQENLNYFQKFGGMGEEQLNIKKVDSVVSQNQSDKNQNKYNQDYQSNYVESNIYEQNEPEGENGYVQSELVLDAEIEQCVENILSKDANADREKIVFLIQAFQSKDSEFIYEQYKNM